MHYHSQWKRYQDAVYWIKFPRAQDQGLQFWPTKSFAIIVHSPVPAECIYRVICQNGDRILFGRLSTPRPAPKVALKSNWHSQQQQQCLCDDVSTRTRKLVTGQSGIRDVRGYRMDYDKAGTRKRETCQNDVSIVVKFTGIWIPFVVLRPDSSNCHERHPEAYRQLLTTRAHKHTSQCALYT